MTRDQEIKKLINQLKNVIIEADGGKLNFLRGIVWRLDQLTD